MLSLILPTLMGNLTAEERTPPNRLTLRCAARLSWVCHTLHASVTKEPYHTALYGRKPSYGHATFNHGNTTNRNILRFDRVNELRLC